MTGKRSTARLRLSGIWALLAIAAPVLALAQQDAPKLNGEPPLATELTPAENDEQKYSVLATAVLGSGDERINSGLVWRIYENVGENVSPALVTKSTEPAPIFRLADGNYIIQATYGYASTSKRLHVQGQPLTETLTINAGALKLSGTVADRPIPSAQISFSVYVSVGTDPEGKLILSNGKPGDIIRLPEGTYHIVSTYGDANAIQRADLAVETGKVTEAVMTHRAAIVTLKLVARPGSEAYADTAFSVLTPGGDVLREAIGAFPQVTLAEGDYVLIARHDNQVYSREFKVEAGLNQDIEVVETKDKTGNSVP